MRDDIVKRILDGETVVFVSTENSAPLEGSIIKPSSEFEGFKVGQLYDWSRILNANKTEVQSRQEDKDN